jgi:hypothetical protein
MSEKQRKPYSQKHDPDLRPDPAIEKALLKRAAGSEVPCTLAFEIASSLGIDPEAVGRTADLLDIRLVKCPLGLFGHRPQKKIINAEDTTDRKLKSAIIGASENSTLSCTAAWELAKRFNISKATVGNVCQANQIKIRGCRLGAF